MSPKEQTSRSEVPSLERDARDDLRDAAVVEMAAKRKRGGAPLTEEEWDQLFRLHAALRCYSAPSKLRLLRVGWLCSGIIAS
jgi:hypothetical protein